MSETINRKIHEALGLGEWHSTHHADHTAPDAVKGWRNIRPPSPDYCSDLNAVRKAELFAIEQKGERAYGEALWDETDCEYPDGWDDSIKMAVATAEQRALAVLKTLGLDHDHNTEASDGTLGEGK